MNSPLPHTEPDLSTRPSAGRGENSLYPMPEERSHEDFERDEEPGRYDVTRPGKVREGSRP